ncbi:MAG: dTDP-4-amino-4,6-dideoxygalactose transaminase [Gammaproteobacteria bacterium]|jgi:dTDP-4-amino-4,6-dideoxygalactose transaminase
MTEKHIPFNKPFMTGQEIDCITDAHNRGQLSGNGYYTKQCHRLLQEITTSKSVLLTHSCTAALEMAAILSEVGPGDEVIMPAFTFVSTANAFVLRGALPVFVDVRSDTLNLDENHIEQAITDRTRVIVVVHYAGVACEMDRIMALAKKHNLIVIEDSAQGILAEYKGRPLGSIGHLAAFSFHETKNVTCGEGGALLINDDKFSQRAEIIWEKGTNRGLFSRGAVDRYTWLDIGSSFLPGELNAAFLFAQLECAKQITQTRIKIWNLYHTALERLEEKQLLIRPSIPSNIKHNAHLYYILLPNKQIRDDLIQFLANKDIHTVFHYLPLDLSDAGKQHCRTSGSIAITHRVSDCLLRLPLWIGVEKHQNYIVDHITSYLLHR